MKQIPNQTDAQRRIGDPYENLANAIVVQAAKDYVSTHDAWKRRSLEHFFMSDYFKMLTEVDPIWLMNTLNLERMNQHKAQRRPRR